MANWYKLDNAAKIFPAIYKRSDTNSFRLSALFYEDIDYSCCYEALKKTLNRFPTFCVRIKRGFFWYYFDHNYSKPLIKEEKPLINDSVRLRKNNGFMFSVTYYGRRLNLEVFHALSDGNGALTFFKTLCYSYLVEKGVKIPNDGSVITSDMERNLLESQDSFNHNYDENKKRSSKEAKAFQIKGSYYEKNWCGLIHAKMSLTDLKMISKKYHSTITEFLSGLILYSVYINFFQTNPSKDPVRLFIPVNARKYFDSVSLRNFALFIRTTTNMNQSLDFIRCLEYVKSEFIVQLNKEALEEKLASNVAFERSLLVRLLPLFLKKIGLKIGFKLLGSSANTITFSNLGKVDLPKEMIPFIERFDFSVSAVKRTPINVTSISYQDTFVLTFITKLIEKGFMKTIFDFLVNEGLKLTIETNELEVEE